MSNITPSMGLNNPDPLVTPGPQYASEISNDLDILDSHTHAPGNGAPIPSAALNINANVPFNGYSATVLGVTAYQSAIAAPSDVNAVSVQAGELVYRDKNGALVVITNNGSIAGATGTITGLVSPASAAYSSITSTLVFSSDTNKAAKLACSDIIQYKFDDTSGAALTHKWAPASPVSYTMTYPDALPATDDSVAKTAADGTQTFNSFGIVPIGGIVAVAASLSGAFPIPTTGTSSRGWQLCDGAAIEGGAILSGTTPLLTDSRFIMGSTSSGATGGANSQTAVGSGTQSLNHNHVMSHTHIAFSNQTAGLTGNATSAPSSTSTSGYVAAGSVSVPGGSFYGVLSSKPSFENNYTTGVITPPEGSAGADARTTTASLTVNFSSGTYTISDSRPKFMTAVYLVRIK